MVTPFKKLNKINKLHKITRAFSAYGLDLEMFYICMYDVFHFGIELAHEVKPVMSKSLPRAKTDKAVKRILKKNLTDFIATENFKLTSFEFAPKDKSITLRVSTKLLDAVQSTAKQRGINYQKLIREALEQYLKRSE